MATNRVNVNTINSNIRTQGKTNKNKKIVVVVMVGFPCEAHLLK
jgi:hypothetical protein